MIVTLNTKLLGGSISFFQSVCVLGYCIFPLNIASFICLLGGPLLWRMLVVAVCFFWSTGASLGARPAARVATRPSDMSHARTTSLPRLGPDTDARLRHP